jgi:phosphoglycerate dehydrogenase-like enzyme
MRDGNVYLVWLEWPEKCFRTDAGALAYLKSAVPEGSEVVRAKTRRGFFSALSRATHVITWYFEKEWFAKAPRLKVLATPSAGMELLPQEAPAGVKIHFGGFHGPVMAESVAAFALAWCRGLFAASAFEGEAIEGAIPRVWLSDKCRSLAGTRAVVVGYGKVGRAIGEKLGALGVSVKGFRRSNIAELPQALKDCDWFVMALPATAQTDDFLGPKMLAKLPRRCVVINVGRGNSIDETALVEALREGRIAGACLDVVRKEPLKSLRSFVSPVRRLPPNLILMPHSAAFYPGYVTDCFRELVDEGLV